MFGSFKKYPTNALRKRAQQEREQARDVQRSGDVLAAAKLYAEAEAL